jgi:hypothetical protein
VNLPDREELYYRYPGVFGEYWNKYSLRVKRYLFWGSILLNDDLERIDDF